VPESQLTTTGFPPVEEQQLHALMADVDFLEAATRRDQIVIGCKDLRRFEDGERMYFQAIGYFFRTEQCNYLESNASRRAIP
jgi:hypothetical protein